MAAWCDGTGAAGGGEAWPARVKNFSFRKAEAGVLDLHYRDYEEPPGNGGFLRNGGRLYLDMGHIEYASPECLSLRDMVAYDLAGDELLQSGLEGLGVADRVSFIKNNVDHHTGATFGCHENYLMKREAQFTPPVLGTLLAFLATRQIFTGAGRVGHANPLAFDFELPPAEAPIDFQISQRADHIVNDIYQWVQFNRAIINARDEPLADYRKYRRLHLLIGDSNMSPFATALKIGTTACILSLLENRQLEENFSLLDAVQSTRDISRDPTHAWLVRLENGETIGSLDLQWEFYELAPDASGGQRTRRRIGFWRAGASRSNALEPAAGNTHRRRGLDHKKVAARDLYGGGERRLGRSVAAKPRSRISQHRSGEGAVLRRCRAAKRIGEWNNSVRRAGGDDLCRLRTHARPGRARAVAWFQEREQPYAINWDSIACEGRDFLVMGIRFTPTRTRWRVSLRKTPTNDPNPP